MVVTTLKSSQKCNRKRYATLITDGYYYMTIYPTDILF